jgi:hypothetical protein
VRDELYEQLSAEAVQHQACPLLTVGIFWYVITYPVLYPVQSLSAMFLPVSNLTMISLCLSEQYCHLEASDVLG